MNNWYYSGEDVGKNFFLTKDCIGLNRGEAACKLLQELNPHVRGHVIDEVGPICLCGASKGCTS